MKISRGGFALLGLVSVVVLTAMPNNAPIFIVMSFFIALILVNIPFARSAVSGISVRRDHPTHAKENSEMAVRLRVTNTTGRSRILIRLFDRGPGGTARDPVQLPILPAKSTKELYYNCRTGRRGIYSFKECRAESSSPFGLVNSGRNLEAHSNLVVYPLYYDLMGAVFPFQKTYSGMTAAPGSRPGEGPSFFGLREYRIGDPIRKIHWPSTLRAGKVIIKEFEEDMHSSVSLFLDTDRDSITKIGDDSNLEAAVRVAASVANHTLVNGHPTSMIYSDEATRSIRIDNAIGNLTPVLDGLARLQPSGMMAAETIRQGGSAAAKFSNWIVILLAPDEDAIMEIMRSRAMGVDILLVIVDWSSAGQARSNDKWLPRMLGMLDDSGVNVLFIRPGDDIQAVLSRDMRTLRTGAMPRARKDGI